jgi:hypothetical protein
VINREAPGQTLAAQRHAPGGARRRGGERADPRHALPRSVASRINLQETHAKHPQNLQKPLLQHSRNHTNSMASEFFTDDWMSKAESVSGSSAINLWRINY